MFDIFPVSLLGLELKGTGVFFWWSESIAYKLVFGTEEIIKETEKAE